ncbi:MAG: hypothetical protein K0R92_1359 [Lachnospiraceae bacterium]|nr:hypothetical protein [Lachnospiraceae bacterium]
MAKYCTRHGFPIPDDTKICNGCGNKCDFTHTSGGNARKYVAVIVGLLILAVIIFAAFNT